MYGTKGMLVTLANKKLVKTGVAGVDYVIDGNLNGLFLLTADVLELPKGRKTAVTLTTQVRPTDRTALIKVNPEIYRVATVTGPFILDQFDDGIITLMITPKMDIDLVDLDYIVKILVEV
jgi:hypothetical protein